MSPVAGGHSYTPGFLLKEVPETLPWPSCIHTECSCDAQMSTRLVLNNILAWGFHCGFTICPKDERTLLKDVWMFFYQMVQIKELLCAVLELLWVLQFSENAVVIIPTCWYQELLPCRDQGTADWWYHVFPDNPLHWVQNQAFTVQAVPALHFRYGILCTLPLANFWSFFFLPKGKKKTQNKTKSTMTKTHNIKKKNPVGYFNPVSGWKTLHHLTRAQDRVWNESSKQKELLTQHMRSLLPEEILARLPLRSWESSSSFWLLIAGM